MNIEQSEEFYIIIKKVRQYIPDVDIEFRFNQNTESLELIFIQEKSVMTILHHNTWDEIKRHINTIISKNKEINCRICCDKIKSRTGCTKCASDWCHECYINMFKTGKGIIKCPFCRYIPDVCRLMNEEEILLGERMIRDKIKNKI